MDQNERFLKWAVELQSLAQAGLYYTRDDFDRERFGRIREIAAEMASFQTDLPLDKIKDLFCGGSGYQTPKLDTRAAIFQQDKILLVHERNGTWSLPGGWVDVDRSIKENTIKEVREEAGLEVSADLVIAIHDRDKHSRRLHPYKICQVFVLCSVLGGAFAENLETTESGYFSLDDLPVLATEKNTEGQIRMCFDAYHSPDWKTVME